MTRKILLSLLLTMVTTASPGSDHGPTSPRLDYRIIVTGGELLHGAYPDAHTCFIARTLYPLGLHCVGSAIVDDWREDIEESLRLARTKVRLVIVTGGLGPTENDVTRQTLAHWTGIKLVKNSELIAGFERRLKLPWDQIRPNLQRQVEVPQRGTYLKSASGTAAGLVFEQADGVVVALPGPPRELQPMVRDELVPYLTKRFGTRPPGASIILRFVGLGQSQISQTIEDRMMLPPETIVYSTFEGSRVDYIFSHPEATPEARARLERLKQQILAQLGDHLYADNETSLEEHVAGLLSSRNCTLAVAEVAGTSSLASALGGVESGRKILAGAWMAATVDRLRTLLRVPDDRWKTAQTTGQRTNALAAGAAEAAGSKWAVAVGEIRDSAPNSRTVEVAVRAPDGRVDAQRLSLRGSGETARAGLVTQILDELRRRLR